MYTGLQHLHSYFAYLVLLALVVAVVHAVLGLTGKRPFSSTSRKLALFGLIFAHLQFVFGLVIYFISPMGMRNLSGETMKDPVARLFALEHPLMMLVAIILITIGYAKAKRATVDAKKFKLVAWFYGIGLLLILSRIPWATWP
ncbi:MAG: hypothetical protein WBG34_03140 [Flavobacteriales bacterium]